MRRISVWWVVSMLAALSPGVASGQTRLIDAIKSGIVSDIRSLLQQSVDVNSREVDGTTALHWAVHHDDVTTVALLIRAGADVNVANRYGVMPLSVACTNGNADTINLLLQAGADPNASFPGGETALMTVARSGNAAAVRALLANGADPNRRERTRGQTALMWAAAAGNAAVIKVLVDGGADFRIRSTEPTSVAQEFKPARAIYQRNYARRGRIDSLSPLLFAVRGGHINAVEALLHAGADINDTATDGTSALVMAILNAHYELAALLLDKGAQANAAVQGWTALHQVARMRTLALHRFPLPVPTGRVSTIDLAKKLMTHGADVNARMTKPIRDTYPGSTGSGDTPMLLAAKGADAELMRLLAANGADPLLTNESGTTVLMAAAGIEMSTGTNEEAAAAVKFGLELGIDVNAINKGGDTAMHGAALRGSNAIVQTLVDNDAKIDMKNKKGYTPLQVANGDEPSAVGVERRPWTVEFLRKLLTDRGLSTEVCEDCHLLVAPR